jgi:tRNA dimethylallyltransferase
MKNKAIIVTGPTATGKTSLAVAMSRLFTGQILSADSRQVYRGLDIGTGKDLAEYTSGGFAVKHYLIDVVAPMSTYSLYDWREGVIDAFAEVAQDQALPIICGGTPLYLDMLLKNYELKGSGRDVEADVQYEEESLEVLKERLLGLSEERYQTTDLTQRERIIRAIQIASTESCTPKRPLPEMDYLVIAPYWHRKIVHSRIELRLKQRWDGMKVESKRLLDSGVTHEKLQWFGLEYRAMSAFILGETTEKQAFDELLIKIRQFAKRQDIWFRKIEKSGQRIHWLTSEDKLAQAENLVSLFLAGQLLPDPDLRLADLVYGPRTN